MPSKLEEMVSPTYIFRPEQLLPHTSQQLFILRPPLLSSSSRLLQTQLPALHPSIPLQRPAFHTHILSWDQLHRRPLPQIPPQLLYASLSLSSPFHVRPHSPFSLATSLHFQLRLH